MIGDDLEWLDGMDGAEPDPEPVTAFAKCECTQGCDCGRRGPGRGLFLIDRGDRRMKVCTRCLLEPGDEIVKLLVHEDENARELIEYDALGMMVLAGRMDKLKRAGKA